MLYLDMLHLDMLYLEILHRQMRILDLLEGLDFLAHRTSCLNSLRERHVGYLLGS